MSMDTLTEATQIARCLLTFTWRPTSECRLQQLSGRLRQRQLTVDAPCKEMRATCLYLGCPKKPPHEGLRITNSDWVIFMGTIGGTLVEVKVAERERGDWIALFDRVFRPGTVDAGAK